MINDPILNRYNTGTIMEKYILNWIIQNSKHFNPLLLCVSPLHIPRPSVKLTIDSIVNVVIPSWHQWRLSLSEISWNSWKYWASYRLHILLCVACLLWHPRHPGISNGFYKYACDWHPPAFYNISFGDSPAIYIWHALAQFISLHWHGRASIPLS